MSEMVKMYEEAGFEVRVEPLSAVQDPHEGKEGQVCWICFEGQGDTCRVIFTRPRKDSRPKGKEH